MKRLSILWAAALAMVATGVYGAAPATSPELTHADVDAWLDGFLPYALDAGDIAGAVVVVVKDGVVLAQKGYGYADIAAGRKVDPDSTLFRPGSTSKLFTWTAVMQQVQAGKIDLDRDVNTYLDFKIPPYDAQPVTMRQIMTHTAGFEEFLGGLIVTSGPLPPLRTVVSRWIPARIFAPGTTQAYSNYATALAGYIVQRTSGEPFESYIARHIFEPLGMTHSTFVQPLPAALARDISKGYATASQPPKPFEMFAVPPAGSMTTSAPDMARFMIAHLSPDSNPLLNPVTTRQMHDTALTLLPGINRMDLGFYEQNLNGQRIIGHGGDTQWFHSYLWLLLDQHVGVFYSQNSAGHGAVSLTIRESLIQNFVDRYFPAPAANASLGFKTRPADAAAVAGTYEASRRSESGLRRALNYFGQTKVTADAAGGLKVEGFEFAATSGEPRHFVEVAPFLWQELHGHEHLSARVGEGRMDRFSVDSVSPFTVFERVPWYQSTAWLQPALLVSLIFLIGFVLSPLTGWAARRKYGASGQFQGKEQQAYRTSVALTVAALAVLIVWLDVLLTLRFDPLGSAVYLLQIATFIVLPGACLAGGWFLWTGIAAGRGAFSLVFRGGVALACVCLLWVAVAFNLTHLGLDY